MLGRAGQGRAGKLNSRGGEIHGYSRVNSWVGVARLGARQARLQYRYLDQPLNALAVGEKEIHCTKKSVSDCG